MPFEKGNSLWEHPNSVKTRFKKGERISIGTEFKKGEHLGKEHPKWKGDRASYFAIHIWLKKNYGKANKCENPKCYYPRKDSLGKIMEKPKRYEWSLIKGRKHSHNRENYQMLCSSCHKNYDKKT